MKSVSVSELQKWRFCRRAWEFSYDYEITNPSMSPTASSGIAVHDAIAKVLKGDITRKQIPGYVEQVLTKLFLNKEDMYTKMKVTNADVRMEYVKGIIWLVLGYLFFHFIIMHW